MFRVTAKVCDNNQTTVDTNIAFKNAHTLLKGKISGILTIEQILQSPINGIAQDKNSAKVALCVAAAELAGIVFAFAVVNGDNTLKEKVNISKTELLKKRDDQLAPACIAIKNAANDNLAALADYGIDITSLDNFQLLIDNYSGDVPLPTTAKGTVSTQRKNQKKLIRESSELLKKVMDKTIVIFKDVNPDFVTTFKTARIILDPAKVKTGVRSQVTNSADGAALASATVEIVQLGLNKQTDKAGRCKIAPIPNGTYTITCSKPGFKTQTLPDQLVKQGQVLTVNFVLEAE